MRDFISALTSYPNAKETMSRCEILRLIAHKAITLQHLESEERASLYEALGYLPEQEVVVTLQRLLEPCGRGDRDRVRKRLSTLGAYPISCKKLHERHGKLSPTGKCSSCTFRNLSKRAYPTPLLHAMAVDKVFRHARRGGSGKKRSPAKSQRQAPRQVPKPEPPTIARATPTRPEASPPGTPSAHPAARSLPDHEQGQTSSLREIIEARAETRARADAILAHLTALERRLDSYCDIHGDRVFLDGVGWLVRREDQTPRFIIEV